MLALYVVFLVVAAVCFALAATNTAVGNRINLVAAGLFAWVLVPLSEAVKALD